MGAVSASHTSTPTPMVATVFSKHGDRLSRLCVLQGKQLLEEAEWPITPAELVDGRRADDWPDGEHLVAAAHRRAE